METAYIKATYHSIEKPFSIIIRQSHCGGTDKYSVANIDKHDACVLASEGLGWFEEPDWDAYFKKISQMEAERDLRSAQQRLSALNGTTPPKE